MGQEASQGQAGRTCGLSRAKAQVIESRLVLSG